MCFSNSNRIKSEDLAVATIRTRAGIMLLLLQLCVLGAGWARGKWVIRLSGFLVL